ncbi:mucin-2 isoform X2 [Patella vulgata]|uniref:mucin-2 isoform X2 n=1 Tax=Patella vulgata TaxID=6465 RepID=UPI0021803CE1|nr:mucin-2 isoform X2 [Patella vulgata]
MSQNSQLSEVSQFIPISTYSSQHDKSDEPSLTMFIPNRDQSASSTKSFIDVNPTTVLSTTDRITSSTVLRSQLIPANVNIQQTSSSQMSDLSFIPQSFYTSLLVTTQPTHPETASTNIQSRAAFNQSDQLIVPTKSSNEYASEFVSMYEIERSRIIISRTIANLVTSVSTMSTNTIFSSVMVSESILPSMASIIVHSLSGTFVVEFTSYQIDTSTSTLSGKATTNFIHDVSSTSKLTAYNSVIYLEYSTTQETYQSTMQISDILVSNDLSNSNFISTAKSPSMYLPSWSARYFVTLSNSLDSNMIVTSVSSIREVTAQSISPSSNGNVLTMTISSSSDNAAILTNGNFQSSTYVLSTPSLTDSDYEIKTSSTFTTSNQLSKTFNILMSIYMTLQSTSDGENDSGLASVIQTNVDQTPAPTHNNLFTSFQMATFSNTDFLPSSFLPSTSTAYTELVTMPRATYSELFTSTKLSLSLASESYNELDTMPAVSNILSLTLPTYIETSSDMVTLAATFSDIISDMVTLPTTSSETNSDMVILQTMSDMVTLPTTFSEINSYMVTLPTTFSEINSYMVTLQTTYSETTSDLTILPTTFIETNSDMVTLQTTYSETISDMVTLPATFSKTNSDMVTLQTMSDMVTLPITFSKTNSDMVILQTTYSETTSDMVTLLTTYSEVVASSTSDFDNSTRILFLPSVITTSVPSMISEMNPSILSVQPYSSELLTNFDITSNIYPSSDIISTTNFSQLNTPTVSELVTHTLSEHLSNSSDFHVHTATVSDTFSSESLLPTHSELLSSELSLNFSSTHISVVTAALSSYPDSPSVQTGSELIISQTLSSFSPSSSGTSFLDLTVSTNTETTYRFLQSSLYESRSTSVDSTSSLSVPVPTSDMVLMSSKMILTSSDSITLSNEKSTAILIVTTSSVDSPTTKIETVTQDFISIEMTPSLSQDSTIAVFPLISSSADDASIKLSLEASIPTLSTVPSVVSIVSSLDIVATSSTMEDLLSTLSTASPIQPTVISRPVSHVVSTSVSHVVSTIVVVSSVISTVPLPVMPSGTESQSSIELLTESPVGLTTNLLPVNISSVNMNSPVESSSSLIGLSSDFIQSSSLFIETLTDVFDSTTTVQLSTTDNFYSVTSLHPSTSEVIISSTIPLPTSTESLHNNTEGLNTSTALTSYWIRTVLKIRSSVNISTDEFKDDMEINLLNAYIEAYKRQEEIDNGVYEPLLRKKRMATSDTGDLKLQILNISRIPDNSDIDVVYILQHNGEYVPASVASDRLNLFSEQELALRLGHVVSQIAKPYNAPVVSPVTEDKKLWIIGAVLGPIAFIFLIWIVLCCVFRCCKKPAHEENKQQNFSEPHLVMVKRADGQGEREELDIQVIHNQAEYVEEPVEKNSGPAILSNTKRGLYKVNPNPNQNVPQTDYKPSPRKKIPIKKGSISKDDIYVLTEGGDTATYVSEGDLTTSSKPKPKTRKSKHIKDATRTTDNYTGEESMTELEGMEARYQMQPTQHELLDEELLQKAEIERRRNKQRLRELRKTDGQSSNRPSNKDIEESDDVPNEKHLPDVFVQKPRKRPSKPKRSKTISNKNDGYSDDENEEVEKAPESLHEARKRMHQLLDDAFSLLSSSTSSVGNKVNPLQDDKNFKPQTRPRSKKPIPENVVEEKKHTPMYLNHAFTSYENFPNNGIETWSPYRAGDDITRISLPQSQVIKDRTPRQEKLNTSTFSENLQTGLRDNYYTTEPAKPIVIKTKGLDNNGTKQNGISHRGSAMPNESYSYPGIQNFEDIPTTHLTSYGNVNSFTDENNIEMEMLTSNHGNGHAGKFKHRPHQAWHGEDEMDVIKKSIQPGVSPSLLIDSIRDELNHLSKHTDSKKWNNVSNGDINV